MVYIGGVIKAIGLSPALYQRDIIILKDFRVNVLTLCMLGRTYFKELYEVS